MEPPHRLCLSLLEAQVVLSMVPGLRACYSRVAASSRQWLSVWLSPVLSLFLSRGGYPLCWDPRAIQRSLFSARRSEYSLACFDNCRELCLSSFCLLRQTCLVDESSGLGYSSSLFTACVSKALSYIVTSECVIFLAYCWISHVTIICVWTEFIALSLGFTYERSCKRGIDISWCDWQDVKLQLLTHAAARNRLGGDGLAFGVLPPPPPLPCSPTPHPLPLLPFRLPFLSHTMFNWSNQ